MLEPTPLPDELGQLVEQNLARAGPGCDCLKCDAGCCAASGFALLENVALACQEYARGRLNYQFEPGLSAQAFLHKYYDTVQVTAGDCPGAPPFYVFFPRLLPSGSLLLALSPARDPRTGEDRVLSLGEFRGAREGWIRQQSAPTWACVFRGGDIPRGDGSGRAFAGCVLHARNSRTHLTAKPVDCVFGVCREPPALLAPEPEAAARWLAAVGRHCAGAGS